MPVDSQIDSFVARTEASGAPEAIDRPKIAHVSTSDMTIGVLLLNQLISLRDAGFDVVAVCSPGPYVKEVQAAGIRVIPIPMVRALTPGADLRALASLVRAFRQERPAIVHTHTPKAGLLGQYAALLARVPLRVHTIHGLYFPGHMRPGTRRFYVWLERITMRFARLSLSQNPEDMPVAITEGICRADRISYLGNGIDLCRFHPDRVDPDRVASLRRELDIPASQKVVGIVARVNREKGYLEFFAAAARIAAELPETRFLIVGPVEREKFDALDPMQLAQQFGIEANVRVLGLRSDMPELYSLMDVLVLPSHREGFPRSPMEAAALGRPVVATDIRGCRQVVKAGETGLLVPRGDVVALADAVLTILRDPNLAGAMGRAGREHALRHFDETDVVNRTITAYNALLRRRNVPC